MTERSLVNANGALGHSEQVSDNSADLQSQHVQQQYVQQAQPQQQQAQQQQQQIFDQHHAGLQLQLAQQQAQQQVFAVQEDSSQPRAFAALPQHRRVSNPPKHQSIHAQYQRDPSNLSNTDSLPSSSSAFSVNDSGYALEQHSLVDANWAQQMPSDAAYGAELMHLHQQKQQAQESQRDQLQHTQAVQQQQAQANANAQQQQQQLNMMQQQASGPVAFFDTDVPATFSHAQSFTPSAPASASELNALDGLTWTASGLSGANSHVKAAPAALAPQEPINVGTASQSHVAVQQAPTQQIHFQQSAASGQMQLSQTQATQSQQPTLPQHVQPQLHRPLASLSTGDFSQQSEAVAVPLATSEQTSIAAIGQIGSLLEQVAALAISARDLFRQGEHGSSSMCLGDLQRSLTQIGDLGSRSLAMVQSDIAAAADAGTTPAGSSSNSSNVELGHRRTTTMDSEGAARKRALPTLEDLDMMPFKTLRAQDGTPIEQPAAPPSAPPNLLAHHNAAQQAPGPPLSAPPLYHTASAPLVPQLHTLNMLNSPHHQHTFSPEQSPHTPHTPFSAFMGSQLPPNPVAQGTPPTSAQSMGGHSRAQSTASEALGGLRLTDMTLLSASNALHTVTAEVSAQPSHAPSSGSVHQQKAATSRSRSRPRRASSPLPDEWSIDEDGNDDMVASGSSSVKKRRPSFGGDDATESGPSRSGTSIVPPEIRTRLETVLFEFLRSTCSNLEATDARGELIHQTLMPKRMARLEQSEDFRPFKLRIQAFTNAYQDAVNKSVEEPVSVRMIKHFLWSSPYISRFNEDGKKAKSKGNHIWVIEAKKIAVPAGGAHSWEFKRHEPRIPSPPYRVAYVGPDMIWEWTPRVWHPQVASVRAVFTALSMPSWVGWKDGNAMSGALCGTPGPGDEGGEVRLQAHYVHDGQLHRLEHAFQLQIAPLPMAEGTVAQKLEAQQEAVEQAAEQAAAADESGTTDDVSMSYSGEATQYSVIDPQQAPQVLSQIAYPFTPPIFSSGQFFASNEEAVPGQQQQAQMQAQQQQQESMQLQPVEPQAGDTSLSVSLPAHLQMQSDLQPHDQVHVNQARAMLERQQDQASGLQLSMPPVRGSRSNSGATLPSDQQQPNQGNGQQSHPTILQTLQDASQQANLTTMPSLSGKMPVFSPPAPSNPLPATNGMPATHADPMMSPGLALDFDPLVNHGTQMQQQQQRHDALGEGTA